MSFTPNMSAKQVADLDRERGKKFYDPEDTYPDDDHPEEKKPWLSAASTNKSGETHMSGTTILKSFLAKSSMATEEIDLMKDDDQCDILHMDDEGLEIADAKKALTSRSMHIPRPAMPYDKFDIQRSASTVTTRQHSGLRGPEGTAPLVGETLMNAEDDATVRTRTNQEAYKSCNFHGLVHRESTGCGMCSMTMSKSHACDGCGDEMDKIKGGGMACKACG